MHLEVGVLEGPFEVRRRHRLARDLAVEDREREVTSEWAAERRVRVDLGAEPALRPVGQDFRQVHVLRAHDGSDRRVLHASGAVVERDGRERRRAGRRRRRVDDGAQSRHGIAGVVTGDRTERRDMHVDRDRPGQLWHQRLHALAGPVVEVHVCEKLHAVELGDEGDRHLPRRALDGGVQPDDLAARRRQGDRRGEISVEVGAWPACPRHALGFDAGVGEGNGDALRVDLHRDPRVMEVDAGFQPELVVQVGVVEHGVGDREMEGGRRGRGRRRIAWHENRRDAEVAFAILRQEHFGPFDVHVV